jgi:hypothetical protein
MCLTRSPFGTPKPQWTSSPGCSPAPSHPRPSSHLTTWRPWSVTHRADMRRAGAVLEAARDITVCGESPAHRPSGRPRTSSRARPPGRRPGAGGRAADASSRAVVARAGQSRHREECPSPPPARASFWAGMTLPCRGCATGKQLRVKPASSLSSATRGSPIRGTTHENAAGRTLSTQKECPLHLPGEDSRRGAFYGANPAGQIELSLARVSDAAPSAEIEPLHS